MDYLYEPASSFILFHNPLKKRVKARGF